MLTELKRLNKRFHEAQRLLHKTRLALIWLQGHFRQSRSRHSCDLMSLWMWHNPWCMTNLMIHCSRKLGKEEDMVLCRSGVFLPFESSLNGLLYTCRIQEIITQNKVRLARRTISISGFLTNVCLAVKLIIYLYDSFREYSRFVMLQPNAKIIEIIFFPSSIHSQ